MLSIPNRRDCKIAMAEETTRTKTRTKTRTRGAGVSGSSRRGGSSMTLLLLVFVLLGLLISMVGRHSNEKDFNWKQSSSFVYYGVEAFTAGEVAVLQAVQRRSSNTARTRISKVDSKSISSSSSSTSKSSSSNNIWRFQSMSNTAANNEQVLKESNDDDDDTINTNTNTTTIIEMTMNYSFPIQQTSFKMKNKNQTLTTTTTILKNSKNIFPVDTKKEKGIRSNIEQQRKKRQISQWLPWNILLQYWKKKKKTKKQIIVLSSSSSSSSPSSSLSLSPPPPPQKQLQFDYDYYQLEIDILDDSFSSSSSSSSSSLSATSTNSTTTTTTTKKKEKNLPMTTTTTTTTGIILLHPIGVGISKWYYHRLLQSLKNKNNKNTKRTTTPTTTTTSNDNNSDVHHHHRFVIVAPDLLGCGSACNPKLLQQEVLPPTTNMVDTSSKIEGENSTTTERMMMIHTLPLLNISDWTDQIVQLMGDVEQRQEQEQHSPNIDRWCIVGNGGMAPIALQVGQRWVEHEQEQVNSTNQSNKEEEEEDEQRQKEVIPFSKPVTNIILSSPPRLPFFLNMTTPSEKVLKSYRTLCGLPGTLFWWYSSRWRNGKFIQTFSEKNLVADPTTLGTQWTTNCISTARMEHGKNKFATFAFLAGTLQDGCQPSLNALKKKNKKMNKNTSSDNTCTAVQIDIIKGRDIRKNQAKSWFWQTKKQKKKSKQKTMKMKKKTKQQQQQQQQVTTNKSSYKTIRDYVEENGNGGREIVIGGRISLAHEDPEGYSNALLEYLLPSIMTKK